MTHHHIYFFPTGLLSGPELRSGFLAKIFWRILFCFAITSTVQANTFYVGVMQVCDDYMGFTWPRVVESEWSAAYRESIAAAVVHARFVVALTRVTSVWFPETLFCTTDAARALLHHYMVEYRRVACTCAICLEPLEIHTRDTEPQDAEIGDVELRNAEPDDMERLDSDMQAGQFAPSVVFTCQEDVSNESVQSAGCGHYAHRACLSQLVSQAVARGGMAVACPCCPTVMTTLDMQRHLTDVDADGRLRRRLFETIDATMSRESDTAHLCADGSVAPCPGCGTLIEHAEGCAYMACAICLRMFTWGARVVERTSYDTRVATPAHKVVPMPQTDDAELQEIAAAVYRFFSDGAAVLASFDTLVSVFLDVGRDPGYLLDVLKTLQN
jgi:hypothetical protein